MSSDDSNGSSLADRFRKALRQLSGYCHMARNETEVNTIAWLVKWSGETPGTLDDPGSVKTQLKDHFHDWLPQVVKAEEPTLDACLLSVESDIAKFNRALLLALDCDHPDGEDSEVCEMKRATFDAARSSLNSILEGLGVLRDQRDLEPPDSDVVDAVEKDFHAEKPTTPNDLNTWEYMIVKQMMEYLEFCQELFEDLAATFPEE